MRVEDLLIKLDVPLGLLQRIGVMANVEIKNKEQRLIAYEMKRLERYTNQDDFPELVSKLKNKYREAIASAFTDDSDRFFIGTIKWFSDPDGAKDYGFATIDEIGDVYFKRRDVYKSDASQLREGQVVFIRIAKNLLGDFGKLKATRINYWVDEESVLFLVHLKLHNQVPKNKQHTLTHLLTEKLVNLDKNQQQLLSLYIDTIPAEVFNADALDFYTTLYVMSGKELQGSPLLDKLDAEQKLELWLRDDTLVDFKSVREKLVGQLSSELPVQESILKINQGIRNALFESALSSLNKENSEESNYLSLFENALNHKVALSYLKAPQEILFHLWELEKFEVPIKAVLGELANILLQDTFSIPKAFDKESSQSQEATFEHALTELNTLDEETKRDSAVTLFKRAEQYNVRLYTSNLDDTIAHFLWRKELADRAIINEIYREYWAFFEASYSDSEESIAQNLKNIFLADSDRLSQDELTSVLLAHFYDLEGIDTKSYEFFKYLLKLALPDVPREKLINAIKNKADGYVSLKLFLDDYLQQIDYDDVVLYTGLLNNQDQKLFFKKCLSLVEKDEVQLNVSDFKRIISTDYELYAQAKGIGDYKLDFSLSMILNIIDQVAKGLDVRQQTIFEILTESINDPKELLQITGFFDKCHNRQSLKKIEGSDPAEYELFHYKDSNPRFATFCEGRKAVDRHTGKSKACSRSGREYFWCENVTCYDIARKPHTTDEWKQYSLADAFKILKIPFSERQYEQLVGTINKANRFFEHLNCRDCGHILHPSGKDNYGFYRVSNFHCRNSNCNNNENIYLSHCANGRCLDIVDSRDSVRCKKEGYEDGCGWYVCNNCHACCTSRNIRSRAYILNQMNRDYKCPPDGHWDLQKICCNDCGTEMDEMNSNYEEVLQWFLDNKDSHPCIINNGVNRYDKHWFVWAQGKFSDEKFRSTVVNLKRSGFNIPDFDDVNRSSYLIAEPRSRNATLGTYKCPECENMLLINRNDLPADQYQAIVKYHFERTINA